MDRIDEVVRRAFEEGRREYVSLPLSFEDFRRHATRLAQRRIGRSASTEEVAEILARTAGADVFLATACEEKVEGAWEALIERFSPRVMGLARRHGLSVREAEELVADLPGDLLSPPRGGGARTSLGTFDGTGSLFGWLAVVVVRKIVDRARERAARGRAESARGETPPFAPDPASAVVDGETTNRIDVAFRSAWGRLTPRETASLLLRYREGLPQKRIAQTLGVGEPRVSRILSNAVGKLRSAVQGALGEGSSEGERDPDRRWKTLRDALSRSLASSEPSSVLLRSERADHESRPQA